MSVLKLLQRALTEVKRESKRQEALGQWDTESQQALSNIKYDLITAFHALGGDDAE